MADFLVPLAIVLALLTGFSLLGVVLVSAPWPILLFLLVLALVRTQQLLNTNSIDEGSVSEQQVFSTTNSVSVQETPATPIPETPEETLTYRGIRFKRVPPVVQNIDEVHAAQEEVLMYRGARIKRSTTPEKVSDLDTALAKHRQVVWKSPNANQQRDSIQENNLPKQPRATQGNRKIIPATDITNPI